MHIADFTVGHLGANAIVGGGVPIATGAALANRYLKRGNVVCCFAGDGAYANGVVLESLNFAAQAQFTNHFADGHQVRPADHLPGLQQPLRHDASQRRRGHGRGPHGAPRRPGLPTTTCTPRSSTA